MVTIEQVINELLKLDEISNIYTWAEETFPDELECTEGVYRFCIISKTWDKVIKMDQIGACGCCANEAEMYEIGKQYGIEELLLKPTFVDELASGQQIYLQEKATYIQDTLPVSKVMQYGTEIEKITHEEIRRLVDKLFHSRIHHQWLAKLLIIYDKEFVKRFIKWQVETRQNDLHAANIGYRFDKPVILDYANNTSFDFESY